MHEIRTNPYKFIAIFPQDGLGLGDFSTAAAFADKFFEEENISHAQIVLVSDAPHNFAFFNERQFKIISSEELKNSREQIALLVIAPVTLSYPTFIELNIPTAGFYEYDYEEAAWSPHLNSWARIAALGLGERKLGILINKELAAWESSVQAQHPISRLEKLSEIPPGLQTAILGQPFSKEAVCHFAERKKLYFLYPYHQRTQEESIQAVMPFAGGKEVVLVMPNLEWGSFSETSRLEVLEYDWQQDTFATVHEAASEPKIRIITSFIPKRSLSRIRMAAEKETVVTGDGSLGEAICLGSNFVYEELSHKRGAAYAVSQLYGWSSTITQRTHSRAISERWRSRNPRELLALRDRVVQERDAWPNIRAFINRLLADSKAAQYPQIYRVPFPFSPDSIPFDQILRLSTGDIMALQIRDDTGESNIPSLQDSRFETAHVAPQYYTLVRRSKVPRVVIPRPVSRNPNFCQKVLVLFWSVLSSGKQKPA